MKLKKLLAILLAVTLVLTMTVSVSANINSKRLEINGALFIGSMVWSGTPFVKEILTVTTKLQNGNPDPSYGLQAQVWGEYRTNNGEKHIIEIYDAEDTGVNYNLEAPYLVSTFIPVVDGCWLRGEAYYSVHYKGQKVDAFETRTWNV